MSMTLFYHKKRSKCRSINVLRTTKLVVYALHRDELILYLTRNKYKKKGNVMAEIIDQLNNKIVVQDNDLIASVAEMRKMPLKIFEIAVGALDANEEHPEEHREVRIKKHVVFDLLGQDDRNRDIRLRDTMKSLMREAKFHLLSDDEKEEELIAPIESIKWRKDEDTISLTFTPTILPYITLLKQNFTQYRLEYIAQMNSKHSIVLYKLLAMDFNKYKYYKEKGTLTSHQEQKYAHPQYTLEQLKRWTNTEDKYPIITKFRQRVLDMAINEINTITDMHVEVEAVRSGHRISGYQFHLSERGGAPLPRPQVAKPEEDPKRDGEDLMKAMQSEYTKMLMKWYLLYPDDLVRPEIMLLLYRSVYPKYDRLGKIAGKAEVDKHLQYVHKRYAPIKGGNIARYLDRAITQYLARVDREGREK